MLGEVADQRPQHFDPLLAVFALLLLDLFEHVFDSLANLRPTQDRHIHVEQEQGNRMDHWVSDFPSSNLSFGLLHDFVDSNNNLASIEYLETVLYIEVNKVE